MDFKRKKIQYLAVFSVSLATLSLGTFTAWPSPVIPKLLGNETTIVISENEVALMVAMTPPGFVTGGLISRYFSDGFGRRNTMLISAIPNIVGTMFVIFGNSIWYLYVTKFMWGLGLGIIGTVVPMYIGEIADKEIRGTLSICSRVMFNLGSLVVMSVGTFISYSILNCIMLITPVCYLLACLWVPESPYYLLKEGKLEAARNSLRRLRGINEKELEKELTAMQCHVKSDMGRATSVKELFTGKQYRRALIIAVGLKATVITSGTILVGQYFGRIIQESGSDVSLATALITFGAVRFVISIMSVFVVDKVNRRPSYIISYLGTAVSFFIVAIYFILQEVIKIDKELLKKMSFVPFVGILAINAISNMGYAAMTFITISEVFPLNIKAVALTLLSIVGGMLSFATTLTFNFVKQHTGMYGSFIFFTVVCLVAAVFIYFQVPETRGMSLIEIQEILQGDHMVKDVDEVTVSLKSKDIDTIVNDVEINLIAGK